ncbi:hypothetical protein OGAPHI_001517 [Ogataea philodendri]|uniref:Uncharacterized protein n=1 Tax=Ogataea philodendri TaxID=1378263 RepID=A0A9P8T8W0_9ASCO|nr:uncharacterized protein OGAPHI_001517 [Ogataea philodendri]KAH3669396.1 hypothetical protein OGAPHI_001517 [Ogataea philodendri]
MGLAKTTLVLLTGLAHLVAAFTPQEMLLAINDDIQYNVAEWEQFILDNSDDIFVQMFMEYENQNVLKQGQLSSAYEAYSNIFTQVPFAARLSSEAAFIHTNTNSDSKVQDASAYVSIITQDYDSEERVYTDPVTPDASFLTIAPSNSAYNVESLASQVWQVYSTDYTEYSNFGDFYSAMSNSFSVPSATAAAASSSDSQGAAARVSGPVPRFGLALALLALL